MKGRRTRGKTKKPKNCKPKHSCPTATTEKTITSETTTTSTPSSKSTTKMSYQSNQSSPAIVFSTYQSTDTASSKPMLTSASTGPRGGRSDGGAPRQGRQRPRGSRGRRDDVGLRGGAIAGGSIVGAVLFVIAVGALLLFLYLRKKKNKTKNSAFRKTTGKTPADAHVENGTPFKLVEERPHSSVYAELGPLDDDIIKKTDQTTGHTLHVTYESEEVDAYESPKTPGEIKDLDTNTGIGAYFILEPDDQSADIHSNLSQRPSSRVDFEESAPVDTSKHQNNDAPTFNGGKARSQTYETPIFVNEMEHPYNVIESEASSVTPQIRHQEQHAYFILEQEDVKSESTHSLHKNNELGGPYELAKRIEDVNSAAVGVNCDQDYEYDHLNRTKTAIVDDDYSHTPESEKQENTKTRPFP